MINTINKKMVSIMNINKAGNGDREGRVVGRENLTKKMAFEQDWTEVRRQPCAERTFQEERTVNAKIIDHRCAMRAVASVAYYGLTDQGRKWQRWNQRSKGRRVRMINHVEYIRSLI